MPEPDANGEGSCKKLALWADEQLDYLNEKDENLKELRDQQCEFYKVMGCD